MTWEPGDSRRRFLASTGADFPGGESGDLTMSTAPITPAFRIDGEPQGSLPMERGPRPVWCIYVGAGVMCLALWAVCVWASTHLQADPVLHTAALFVHLSSLIAGFGAVLVIDYFGLLWLLGRRSLDDVLALAGCLHLPVWAGTAGLMFTGVFLHPDLSSPLTRVKLIAVLVIALNGVCAAALHRRLAGLGNGPVPARLLLRGAVAACASQVGWWTAVVIGFLNSQRCP